MSSSTSDAPATQSLRNGAVGAPAIAFFVIAAAAPLTCVMGITPLLIGYGVGISAPLVYVLIGLVLLLFAVGYVAMSRRIRNAGSMYAYIAQGLGPSWGAGASFVALAAYFCAIITLLGFFGFVTQNLISSLTGLVVPWYVLCIAAIAICVLLGRSNLEVGAKVLGLLLIAELSVLLILAIAVIFTGGSEGVTFDSWNPVGLFGPGLGVSLAFGYASYIGFEQTAIYSEEAKDPKRSVKRATIGAVIFTSLFYALMTWVMVLAFGRSEAMQIALENPGDMVVIAASDYLGQGIVWVVQILVVTGSFAAILSFHNAISRYFFSLGREKVLPRGLGYVREVAQSPHRGSVTVGVVNVIILLTLALIGADPYLDIFTWGAAASTVGFVFLQTLCSAAIVVYFRRHRAADENTWTTTIAPTLATLVLGAGVVLIVSNFGNLVGGEVGIAPVIIGLLYLGMGAIGFIVAEVMKRKRRADWSAIGTGRIEVVAPTEEPGVVVST
ncbi:APC family permease [Leucobacter rhizosphaerae]|uniref:APC family permease n=1 Tax=Leucobacter rhizosphaerae TaxID=2932245 RepID=A0ABY4FU41_9MICO|nr:APC family permease [Leucobacter rhizosphaerae]UOQ59669.1 APC family permease [Leucobacter rhizosphaerae]